LASDTAIEERKAAKPTGMRRYGRRDPTPLEGDVVDVAGRHHDEPDTGRCEPPDVPPRPPVRSPIGGPRPGRARPAPTAAGDAGSRRGRGTGARPPPRAHSGSGRRAGAARSGGTGTATGTARTGSRSRRAARARAPSGARSRRDGGTSTGCAAACSRGARPRRAEPEVVALIGPGGGRAAGGRGRRRRRGPRRRGQAAPRRARPRQLVDRSQAVAALDGRGNARAGDRRTSTCESRARDGRSARSRKWGRSTCRGGRSRCGAAGAGRPTPPRRSPPA
jgi:hypothetical protein